MVEKGFERKLAAIIITDTKRDNRLMYCHCDTIKKKLEITGYLHLNI